MDSGTFTRDFSLGDQLSKNPCYTVLMILEDAVRYTNSESILSST